jgi:hypothetical protein
MPQYCQDRQEDYSGDVFELDLSLLLDADANY